MNWENLCPNSSFTGENKMGNLHKAGHNSVLPWWHIPIPQISGIYQLIGRNMFSTGKKGILNLFEVLHKPQNDLGKGPTNTLTPSSRNVNNANINSNR